MPANQLTAKANVGAGTDALAGVNTAQGFAGAAMLVHANGADVTGAAPLPVTGPMTIAEYQSSIGTVVFDGPQPVSLDSTVYEDAPHVSGAAGMFALAVRRDADTSAVSADGDYSPFLTDEAGRLKVAATPASFVAITGSISASAGTVVADVSRASNVMAYVTGTFAGHNCTFEGSIDGGTSWFGVQAVRSNANTVETTTGTLSAAPAYAWELSVNALTNFRVRATAHVSGTANWRIQPGSYATEPIPAAQVTGTQPVSVSGSVTLGVTTALVGDVGAQYRTSATGAATTAKVQAAAGTNATSLKATSGRLLGWSLTNTTAAVKVVHIYDLSSAPTVGTSAPKFNIVLPANTTQAFLMEGGAGQFLGLAYSITGGITDLDSTAVAANDVVGAIFYA